MKFLCVSCDEQMKLVETERDDRGSIAIQYQCPDCESRIAMLTNPSETQVVTSLGVKIGKPSDPDALEKCPFGDMVREMGLESSESNGLDWTAEAFKRLNNIPEFIRPMARQGIEGFARSQGYEVVDEAVLDEAKDQFGM